MATISKFQPIAKSPPRWTEIRSQAITLLIVLGMASTVVLAGFAILDWWDAYAIRLLNGGAQ